MNNPVGIGEHPQHTEEMDKLVTQFTDGRINQIVIKNYTKMTNTEFYTNWISNPNIESRINLITEVLDTP